MQQIENTSYIKRRQLDTLLSKSGKSIPRVPKRGWIFEIRNALQMTTAQLARRIGVAQSNITTFENAERSSSITLRSLARIAEALECDLHYVLVPKKGLEKTLSERAKAVYAREENSLEQHMKLEGQGTKTDRRKALEITLLVHRNDKRLWDDE